MRAFAFVVCALISCERKGLSSSAIADGGVIFRANDALPAVEDGDVIFQESRSRQSEMVRALTRSRWTHVGVVFNDASGPMVFEAISPTSRTPLSTWIARGRDGEYVLKRLRDANARLTPDAKAKLRALGKTWLGRPYDQKFRWDDEALYCSELVHKLFERGAAVTLGRIERADAMNLDDERVKRALKKRFTRGAFDPAEPVVTPDSIFNDDELVEVSR
jgi:hypothetical protein